MASCGTPAETIVASVDPAVASPPATLPDYDALVDPFCGLVRELVRNASDLDQPDAYISYTADVSDMRRHGPWPNDPVALGTTFADEQGARRAALGEAVERYCGNFVPAGLPRASYADWCRRGEHALDPTTLVLYSARQHACPGFPFVPFDRDLPVLWTRGVELPDERPVWVPAALVYLNYNGGPRRGEPRTNFLNYAGIACGISAADARERALLELIERDAVTIWWQSGAACEGLSWSDESALHAYLAGPRRDDFDYRLVRLPSPFGVPVVGALLTDHRDRLVAFGTAARQEARAAAVKALLEAVHVRVYSVGLLHPDGSIWKAIRAGLLNAAVYRPHRADRCYLDDYRADFGDVVDLGTHAQLYLDERLHPLLQRILEPPTNRALGALPPAAPGGCVAPLRAAGLAPVAVDLTTPDVRACGFYVARVLVPGLYPNAPAAFPYLGGRRLYEEPFATGWRSTPLREDEVLLAPLPHM
jgi:ribosomal protein S12 methylthiotransferase accessory factor